MEKKYTSAEYMKYPTKQWASREDKYLGFSDNYGHHPSSDAIGGYYGMQWWEIFLDRETQKPYRVSCYDGVYQSKGSFYERPGHLSSCASNVEGEEYEYLCDCSSVTYDEED